MRILVWHVHGGWMEGFVRGRHEYLLPVDPARSPWGLGRGGRAWPDSVQEVPTRRIAQADPDVVVLQRPEEFDLARELTGRAPGTELPAVYLEHNAPRPEAATSRHPFADSHVPVVHVTHFNRLMWDCGAAATTVIEHGVPDPGPLYTGEMGEFAAVINEPLRRGRVAGSDLLPEFASILPVRVYGMGTAGLGPALRAAGIHSGDDLPTARLHAAMARRRAYLHLARWTSLGLSLIEAMHLGMPVLALATTEAPRAIPAAAGAVSCDLEELRDVARRWRDDPEEARRRGADARAWAVERYGLERFLERWDAVLAATIGGRRLAGEVRGVA